VRSPDEQVRWSIILPLKNRDVRKATFQKRTGRPLNGCFRGKIENLKAFGLLVEDEQDAGPDGIGGRFLPTTSRNSSAVPATFPFPPAAYNDGPLNPYHNCNATEET